MKDTDKIIQDIKKKFPGFTDEFDSVRRAIETVDYIEKFPEDMVEERTSWDELNNMLDRMCYGFNKLLNLFVETNNSKGDEK